MPPRSPGENLTTGALAASPSGSTDLPAHRGRGSSSNTANRFSEMVVEIDASELTEADLGSQTRYLDDTSRTVISTNTSPDLGFDASLNPYRGCEHGCSYCYARPTHEYFGLSAGLDFERVILVKKSAPTLLENDLRSPSWRPRPVMLSGVTDPYQPIERRLGITRECLKVLASFKNPVSLITKNALVTRDIDVLSEMATWNGASVTLSITTLDEGLRGALEPRTSTIRNRLNAVKALSEAGVPVGVNMAPIIPGLTDDEIPELLAAAAAAGATHAGFTLLRLPGAVSEIFAQWLDRHAPLRKQKVLNKILAAHAGEADDRRFGKRMTGTGPYAEQVGALFRATRKRLGIPARSQPLEAHHFAVPGRMRQGTLF